MTPAAHHTSQIQSSPPKNTPSKLLRYCKGNPLPPRLSISNSASASDASSAFRRLLRLPTPLPPSDASSAFQCVFRLQMRLPLHDLSYASRPVSCTCLPRYVSSPAAYLVSRGMTRLPRHTSSPAAQLVFRSSRFGSSPLPTSRDITLST